jgi:hypothetical protein
MDYKKIYNQLILKAKNSGRKKGSDVYYVGHHIQPRCFGGTGSSRNPNHPNIVFLTTKEHYIAHLLLVAIYPKSTAMAQALWNMCHVSPEEGEQRYKPGARMYKHIRDHYIKNASGINGAFYNKKHTAESLIKIGTASKGRNPFLGKTHSEETRKKLSEIVKEHHRKRKEKVSNEINKKISESTSGKNHYNAKPIVCLKTNTIFGSGVELSNFLNIPTSSIRRWLNGTTTPPKWFNYKRQNLAYDQ